MPDTTDAVFRISPFVKGILLLYPFTDKETKIARDKIVCPRFKFIDLQLSLNARGYITYRDTSVNFYLWDAVPYILSFKLNYASLTSQEQNLGLNYNTKIWRKGHM